jgi:hypothetical protein
MMVRSTARFSCLVLVAPLGIKPRGRDERDIADMHGIERTEYLRLAWAEPAKGEADYTALPDAELAASCAAAKGLRYRDPDAWGAVDSGLRRVRVVDRTADPIVRLPLHLRQGSTGGTASSRRCHGNGRGAESWRGRTLFHATATASCHRAAAIDEVWHLGDFAIRRRPAVVAKIFARLHGRKHLVTGNNAAGYVSPTISFQRSIMASFIAATDAKGRR